MKFIITNDYEEMSRLATEVILTAVKNQPDLTLCLPSGSTPILMYKMLVESYQRNEIDFSHVNFFNMDEYVGLDYDHPDSYAYFTRYHLLDHVNANPDKIFHPKTKVGNIKESCQAYSKLLKDFGGIDLAVDGIGDDGHIAFNEPAAFLQPLTHIVELNQETIEANAHFFNGDTTKVPTQAVSIGMEEIMKCKKFVVLAAGKHKAHIFARLFSNENIDPWFPASFLRLHQNVTFILDKEAAALIPPSELIKYN